MFARLTSKYRRSHIALAASGSRYQYSKTADLPTASSTATAFAVLRDKLTTLSPCIPINANNVDIVTEPTEFYSQLTVRKLSLFAKLISFINSRFSILFGVI